MNLGPKDRVNLGLRFCYEKHDLFYLSGLSDTNGKC
jgi:hypothetical protein